MPDTTNRYASNPHARANRYAKAKAVAGWCWENGLTTEHLLGATPAEWRSLARLAGQGVPSDETQHLIYSMLIVKEAWAAANPKHPDAQRAIRTPEQVEQLTKRKAST